MHWIYDLSRTAPFQVKTTEAPSYRRIALSEMRREGMSAQEIERTLDGVGCGDLPGRRVDHLDQLMPVQKFGGLLGSELIGVLADVEAGSGEE